MNRELIRIPTTDDYERDSSGKWVCTNEARVVAVIQPALAQAIADGDYGFCEGFRLGETTTAAIWSEDWIAPALHKLSLDIAWSTHHAPS